MPDETTPAPEIPVAPAEQEVPATATFVEDAETGVIEDAPVESQPETIVMQPEDPVVEEVTQPGNNVEPAPEFQFEAAREEVVPAPAPATGAPKVVEINAEMNAGAARVAEHEQRERMLESKRAKEESGEKSEEQQVSDATSANKDL